jgi:hypothetical protein
MESRVTYTDREVTANRPDIRIKNEIERTCIFIDVSIPVDRNVMQKEAEKKLKYQMYLILYSPCILYK